MTATDSPAVASESGSQRRGLGIDVGGSGVKGGIVDLDTGQLIGERFKLPTPQPSTPDSVAKTIAEVVETGEPVRLSPMNPFERKIVHDVVAGAGLVSESEDEEPRRRVVVLPKN